MSEACISAVYNLASIYFIYFASSVGTTKICQWKSEKNYFFTRWKDATKLIYSCYMHSVSFL